MPVSPDLSVFGKNQSFSDYQRANDEFAQRKALQQAQIQLAGAQAQKALVPDIEDIGKRAYLKRAQGMPLTQEENGALTYIVEKSQGYSINPITGETFFKPGLTQRPGMGGNPPSNSSINPPESNGLNLPAPVMQGGQPQAPANMDDLLNSYVPQPNKITKKVTPKTQQTIETEAAQSGRKRVDEYINTSSSSGAAKQAANTMANLLPNMGYTGTGAGAVAFADKALTGLGLPDLIKGKPEAREAFNTLGVDAWVKAVEPLKGALSEKEGGRFDLAISNLTTTPEGIKLRAKLTDALAKRAAEKAQFYESYLAQNATLDGADAIWNDYSNRNPAITDELLGVDMADKTAKPVVLSTDKPAPSAKITGSSPIVSTQAQYDALPSGAAYIEVGVDGKPMKMRKP